MGTMGASNEREGVATTGGEGVEQAVVGAMGTEVGCMGEAVLSGLTALAVDEMGTDNDCTGEAAMSGVTSLEGFFCFVFLRFFGRMGDQQHQHHDSDHSRSVWNDGNGGCGALTGLVRGCSRRKEDLPLFLRKGRRQTRQQKREEMM